MPDSPLKNDTPDSSDKPADELTLEVEVSSNDEALKQESNAEPKVKLPEPSKRELEALKVSAIESMEVKSDQESEPAVDPDTEIKFKPKPPETPWWKKPQFIVPIGLIVLLVILFAIPFTRYAALGSVWRKDVTVVVQDEKRGSGIPGATVTIAGNSAETDSTGRAVVKNVGIGEHTVAVQKRFYGTQESRAVVDIITTGDVTMKVAAEGTIVAVTVTDRLTNAPVKDAVIASKDIEFGKTNAAGLIDVVIPKGKQKAEVSVTSPKHTVLKTEVTEKTKTLKVVPSGAVYYLEKQDGKMNVVRANFDGSDRKVIVPATGNETDRGTLLLANRDWKYAVLQSKRAPNKPDGLYLIDTKTDTYKVLDDGQMQFTVIGWIGNSLIYQSTLSGNDTWRDKSTALKSFDAASGKTTVLDENASDKASTSVSAAYETIGAFGLNESAVTYAKTWTLTGAKTLPLTGKNSQLITVKPDGSGRTVLKTIEASKVTDVAVVASRPGVAQYAFSGQNETNKTYGEVSGGAYKDVPNADAYKKEYPAYVLSPSGNKTVWTKQDGEITKLSVGDKKGEQAKEVTLKGVYSAYGWVSDDFILVQKDNAELYIIAASTAKSEIDPLKVGAYFRTNNLSVVGYGGR